MRKPSKFIAFQERRLGRSLTGEELAVLAAARNEFCHSKRDMIKAMWAALEERERAEANPRS